MADSRMYEQKYPEPDDIVQVHVKRVMEMGAYVSLLEYGNCEGMIMLSELSKRRIRSIKNLIRVGQVMACSVIRVDQNKGYIDLSRRRVSAEEAQAMDEKYAKSKMVHSVMRHTSQQHDIPMEELCAKVSWPLYKNYPHAFDAFKVLVSSASAEAFKHIDESINDTVRESLVANIRRRLAVQAVRLRAKVDVTCFDYEGIEAVRAALVAGKSASNDDVKLEITLVAPPCYQITTTCIDRSQGTKTIENAMDIIQKEILARKGQFTVKSRVEIVGAHDDNEALLLDNADSDSDDSGSEEEQEGMGELDEEALAALQAKELVESDDEN